MEIGQSKKFDLIVVGGGVLGTFHAYHALKKGLSVALLEKNKRPQGASVRNFGQVVPSGMDAKWQRIGRDSLQIYKDLQAALDISVRQEGTIYIASNEEEMQLLEELEKINTINNYPSTLLDKAACLDKYPGLKSSYCKGGLFFPEEITVNPRVAVLRILSFLEDQYALSYFPQTPVVDVYRNGMGCIVVDSQKQSYQAEQVIVCSGSDFKFLFPELYLDSDLEVVKLNMLQTVPQKKQRIPGSVLTGLTIRRYESFRECPSYAAIKSKESTTSFAKQFGIHILFKQAVDGSMIIGDSHEYASVRDADDLGFDMNNEINRYIMSASMKIFDLEDWSIEQAWNGFYCQSTSSDIFQQTIDDHIHIITGIGGKGMTGSPGFAKKTINELFNLKEA